MKKYRKFLVAAGVVVVVEVPSVFLVCLDFAVAAKGLSKNQKSESILSSAIKQRISDKSGSASGLGLTYDLSALKIALISRSRSSQEVNRNMKILGELQRAQLACKRQLQNDLLPAQCFHQLRLESSFGLLSETNIRHFENLLDSRCEKVVSRWEVIEEIPQVPKRYGLSSGCAKIYKNRRDQLKYMASEHAAGTIVENLWSEERGMEVDSVPRTSGLVKVARKSIRRLN